MQAIRQRDCLARELYQRLFEWLVRAINTALLRAKGVTRLCILDTPGFEVMVVVT
jgi:myosin heavy subunit